MVGELIGFVVSGEALESRLRFSSVFKYREEIANSVYAINVMGIKYIMLTITLIS